MKMGNISFDNPDDPMKPSRIFTDIVMRLEMLDYARRSYERQGDEKRAEELRKFFRQVVKDSVILVRSLVPEDLLAEHSQLFMAQISKFEAEKKEQKKRDRKLAELEEDAKKRKGKR